MPTDDFASDPRLNPYEDAWESSASAPERRAVEERVRRELPALAEQFLGWVGDMTRIQAEELAKRWRDTAPPERMERAAEFRAQLLREYGEPAVVHFNELRAKMEAAERTEVLGPFDIVENFARWELRVADGVVYHLDDRLGSGGMAVVGKARRSDNRDSAEWPRLIVCKIWGDDKLPGVVEALRHETRLLSEVLSGPHVVRCVGSGVLRPVGGKSEAAFHALSPDTSAPLQPGDRPCLLLGFTPGAVSLAELLASDRGRWKNDPRLVLRFLSEAARGFVHLHDTDSVAHGDVKPANFLVHLQALLHPAEDSPVPVQLIDFGIAQRVLKARGGRASTRRAPDAYSPPEVMNQELFRASDLFGLGLTAVELLSGCDIHAIHTALPSLCNGLKPDGGGGLTVCALFDFILSQHDRPPRNRLRLLRQPLENFFTATLAANYEARCSAAEAVNLLVSLRDALTRTYPTRPASVPAHGVIRLGNPVVTEFFTPVGDFQTDLERDFDREQPQPIPEVEVIYGFGGRGKSTQTARFWHRSAASGRYELVLWTNALSRERLELELATLLAEFDPAAAARKESPVAYFKSLLASCPNWLWVLNNCPDEAYGRDAEHDELRPASRPERPASLTGWLEDFLPPQGFGHLIITSRFDPDKFSAPLRAVWFNDNDLGRPQRSSPFPAGRRILEMDQPTALGFLLRRAGWRQARPGEADLGGAEGWLREPRPDPRHNDPHAAGLSHVQLAHARELVGPRHLNCLPLALEFAGAHLGNERDLDFADYTRSFERRLTLLEKAFDPECHDPLGLLTITATYLPLIEHIAARHPEAAALLTLSAFLDPDLIPGEFLLGDGLIWADPALARLLSGETPRDRVLDLEAALRILAEASLIQFEVGRANPPDGDALPVLTWSMHRVLQDVIRRQVKAGDLAGWQSTAAAAVLRAFHSVRFDDPANIPLGRRWLPGFGTVEKYLARGIESIPPQDIAEGYDAVGMLLHQDGRFPEAEIRHRQAVSAIENSMGAGVLDLAKHLDHLAITCLALAQPQEAEALLRRAVSILQQHLGASDIRVASMLNLLANSLDRQGRYLEAEAVTLEALSLIEMHLRHLGQSQSVSPSQLLTTLESLNRITEPEQSFYQNKSNTPAATARCPSPTRMAEPKTGRRFSDAEAAYFRGLHLAEATLGAKHPELAASLCRFAEILWSQGHYYNAEPLFRRALEILEAVHGTEHINLAPSLRGLAKVLLTKGRQADSEALYRRTSSIQELTLGSEHPELARTLQELGTLLAESKRYKEAEIHLKRALAIREIAMGPTHPLVAESSNHLANLFFQTQRWDEAEPLYNRALTIAENSSGVDNLGVATVLLNIASLLDSTGRTDQAETVRSRAATIAKHAVPESSSSEGGSRIERVNLDTLMHQLADESITLYVREVDRVPPLSFSEEVHLSEQIRAGDINAKRRLVRHSLRLVVEMASRYRDCGLAFLDLIQEGNLGLIRAAERFDATRGYRFGLYAEWWVRQAIQGALATKSRTIRVPVGMVETINKFTAIGRALSLKLGRRPTEVELAKALDMPLDAINALKSAMLKPISFGEAETHEAVATAPPVRDRTVEEIRESAADCYCRSLWEAAATHLEKLITSGEPVSEHGPKLITCLLNAHEDLLPTTAARIETLLQQLEASGTASSTELRRQFTAKQSPINPTRKWWKN